MNNFAAGAVFIILGLATASAWWWDVLMLMKGLLPVLFLTLGAVAIAAGLSPTEERKRTKRSNR